MSSAAGLHGAPPPVHVAFESVRPGVHVHVHVHVHMHVHVHVHVQSVSFSCVLLPAPPHPWLAHR